MKKYLFGLLFLSACGYSGQIYNNTQIELPTPPKYDYNFFLPQTEKGQAPSRFLDLVTMPDTYLNDSLWLAKLPSVAPLIAPVSKKTKFSLQKRQLWGSYDSLVWVNLGWDRQQQQFLFAPDGELIKYSNLNQTWAFLPLLDSGRAVLHLQDIDPNNNRSHGFYKYDNKMLISVLDNFSERVPSLQNCGFIPADQNQDGNPELIFTDSSKTQHIFIYNRSKDMFMYQNGLK